jgi:hypothetical protein
LALPARLRATRFQVMSSTHVLTSRASAMVCCCSMLRTTRPRPTTSATVASPNSGSSPARLRSGKTRARAGVQAQRRRNRLIGPNKPRNGPRGARYPSRQPFTAVRYQRARSENHMLKSPSDYPTTKPGGRHAADEDRSGDHPARGGSSDWRSLRKSSRSSRSWSSFDSSCFGSWIKPFFTAS